MPAGSTYSTIATTTASGSVSQITFTSISGSFTDLVLISNFTGVSGNNFSCRVGNGSIDSGANYSYTRLSGNGTSAASIRSANDTFISSNLTLGTNGSNSILNFMNYSNTSTFKTVLHRFNDAGAFVAAVVGLYRSTSAINQVQIFSTNSVNFAAGSTFTLYGIAAA